MARGNRRLAFDRHALLWAVVSAAVCLLAMGAMIAVFFLSPLRGWGERVVPWGHPKNGFVFSGTWDGSFGRGSMTLVLREDHSFSQHVYSFPGLPVTDYSGTWSYWNGTLFFSPGLMVDYTRESGSSEYFLLHGATLKVHNTVHPSRQWIGDEGASLRMLDEGSSSGLLRVRSITSSDWPSKRDAGS